MTLAVNIAQSGSSNVTFRNRIINGAMVIDQRNAGASVTPASGTYTLDRWLTYQSVASKFSVQQNAGAVTPPIGFGNYLGATSLSSYAVLSGDYYLIQQMIEGFNTVDLAFGTANAKTVTLSFWVYSSLTGTFGGVLNNSASNRTYPFTYTISSANTWEQKSITIAGDTSGTWIGATNGIGLMVRFGLGVGSTYSGTAGAWAGSQYFSATGATSVVGTNGATFYITGVQLEAGTTASPFEYRQYDTEVSLCQRYYEKSYNLDVVPGTSGAAGQAGMGGSNIGTTTGFLGASFVSYKVTKRVAGTITSWDNAGAIGKSSRFQLGVSGSNNQNWTLSSGGTQAFSVYSSGTSSDTGFSYSWICEAEL
jgi:hypothetical protein